MIPNEKTGKQDENRSISSASSSLPFIFIGRPTETFIFIGSPSETCIFIGSPIKTLIVLTITFNCVNCLTDTTIRIGNALALRQGDTVNGRQPLATPCQTGAEDTRTTPRMLVKRPRGTLVAQGRGSTAPWIPSSRASHRGRPMPGKRAPPPTKDKAPVQPQARQPPLTHDPPTPPQPFRSYGRASGSPRGSRRLPASRRRRVRRRPPSCGADER